jgi:hypothetical protein
MNMRGSLNVSRYQKSAAQPRFYGKALIHGVEYTIKGWEKENAQGPWISLLFEDPLHGEPTEEAPAAPRLSVFSKPLSAPVERAATPPPVDDRRNKSDLFDDDIPF